MSYWVKFAHILVIILNSMALLLTSITKNYLAASISGLFVIISATNLLVEQKSN